MSNFYKEHLRKQKLIKKICILIGAFLCIVIALIGIKIYNPEKHFIINSSDKAYRALQENLTIYYKKNGCSFKMADDGTDDFCTYLGEKIGKSNIDCYNDTPNEYKLNFVINKSNIQIFGTEKPSYKMDGTYVKDFFIDIDGKKGENRIGADRFPLRVYLKGRMSGLLVPINCNKEDEEDYGFITSKVCQNESDTNFLNTTIPFGYDVIQIGGKKGKTVVINSDVPFLRADCTAFGGEMIANEFCDEKGYPWLEACYDEFPCATRIAKEKL